jgi:hypothetical protein
MVDSDLPSDFDRLNAERHALLAKRRLTALPLAEAHRLTRLQRVVARLLVPDTERRGITEHRASIGHKHTIIWQRLLRGIHH